MNALKPSSRIGSVFLIIIGILWAVISGIIVFSTLAVLWNGSLINWFDPTLLLMIAFPVLGLVFVAVGLYPWISGLRVTRPEIVIDKPALVAGEAFTVSYSQNFKRRSEVRGIHLFLILRESAYHHAGKNSHTYHHKEVISQYDHPGQTFESGDTLAFSHPVEIPKSGMHTFHAGNNSIDWVLNVRVDIAGWPDYQDSYDLQVSPFPVK